MQKFGFRDLCPGSRPVAGLQSARRDIGREDHFTRDSALLGDLIVEIPVASRRSSVRSKPRSVCGSEWKTGGRLSDGQRQPRVTHEKRRRLHRSRRRRQRQRGDYLTIYRKLGTGNLTRVDNEELRAIARLVSRASAIEAAVCQTRPHALKMRRRLSMRTALSISSNHVARS